MMVFTSTQQEVDEQWGLYEGWARLASCTPRHYWRGAYITHSQHRPSRRLVDCCPTHAQLSSKSQPVDNARLQDHTA